jgi:hypothetical protein
VNGEPRVYIALQGDEGELVVNGSLDLLERFVMTLFGGRDKPKRAATTLAEDDGTLQRDDRVNES